MQKTNLDVARHAYDALRRDDLDALADVIHPEVEWHSLVLEIEGVFRGHDGVREWWRSIRAAFPDWKPEVVGFEEHGDWVLLRAHATGSGAASGVGIVGDFFQVGRFRDGLIVEYHAVRTRNDAMRVIGSAG